MTMQEDFRPDPDIILKSIKHEESKLNKGKLYVFLGMCAGVGKTYAMLQAAHQAKKEGIDVVIGYIETHGRIETDQLVEGIEKIPLHTIDYRGIQLQEMDIDSILIRKPQLVLVDELAHTNIKESRHTKRYEDVNELLYQGINVYTALNVQHLESYSETVNEITNVRIHETIPDSFLQNAEIRLIDITPDELLKRMKEGKVYIPEKANIAVMNFFQHGNLYALRELALRFTAERVDMEMVDYMRSKNIYSTWKATEKLMVAVGTNVADQKLIRWTRRMAFKLGAQWIAVSIDLGNIISKKEQEILIRNQELAKSLGAEIIQINDNDVVSGLLKVAIQYNVTQIVVGKTNKPALWYFFSGGDIVNQLLKNSGNINIYVVKANKAEFSLRKKLIMPYTHFEYGEYIRVIVVIGIVAIIMFPFKEIVGYQTIGIEFLIAIAAMSLSIGRLPIIFAALLGSAVWNYFFIPPIFTFQVNSVHDMIMLFANFFIAMMAGTIIHRFRKSKMILQKSQDNLSVLLSILETLNNTSSINDVVDVTRNELTKYFDADAVIYLKDKQEKKLAKQVFGNTSFFNEKEFSVAHWCFENQKQAGRFTNTLPLSMLHYFPLVSKQEIIGVLGIQFHQDKKLSQEKMILLRSFISQITASLQREINLHND